MKRIISTIIILLPLVSFAQKDTIGMNIPVRNGSIIYTGIVNINGKSKAGLYKNAKQWFVDYFKSSNDAIQNQDKEKGLIIGKGVVHFYASFGYGLSTTWHDRFTVKLECRDGKYRYSIYDMIIYPNDRPNQEVALEDFLGKILGTKKAPVTKLACKDVLKKNDIAITNVIASINEQMNKTISDL